MGYKIFNFENMEQVKQANKRYGRYWFSPETMSFFNSIIETSLLDEGFFVTSERYDLEDPKRYTIRKVKNVSGHIITIGRFKEFKSLKKALEKVHELQMEVLQEYVDKRFYNFQSRSR